MDEFWLTKKREYDSEINSHPSRFAIRISGNMLLYPMAHVIRADYLSNWNPKAIQDLLKYFTPERMRIDFASESVKGTDLKLEPWFKSWYREEQIPASIKEAWSSSSELLLHASLCFPSPNKFIPTSLVARSVECMQLPVRIVDTPSLNMWYKLSNVDSSCLYFLIHHKGGYSSLENHVMMRLFTEILKDEVNDILYQSQEAGVSSSITLHDDQLLLKVSGYWEKLNLWLSDIWKSFMNFSLTIKGFEIIKEKIKTHLSNLDIYYLSDYVLDQVLVEKSYSICKALEVLDKISFAGLENFIHVMRSEIFIDGICSGELLPDEAMDISSIFQTTPVSPLPKDVRHTNRILSLQTKLRRINVKVSNINSVMKLYFRIGREKGRSMRKRAMIHLFREVIYQVLFDKLRTEEQLGYIVSCSPHIKCGVLGFTITVVSAKYSPSHLLKRVTKFVNLIGGHLDTIPQESFEDYKDGLIAKLNNDISITLEEIISKRYTFDSYSREVGEIKRIKKKHILRWYRKQFRSCHRIALCLWGSETKMKKKRTKKRNGLRHVKIPKVLKLSSTRLPQMTFKKVRKVVTNRKSSS
ncbi:PREDICTED: nardilysin-like [Camelina sativa]|uniref:Nardilysin-like n=1 Tax=Camelina sativa TaxID=90675 RepID=A0ABM0Y6Z5_CAMSA|nr:PREDICTED: nardilysin-like [Camelina sativa]